MQFAAQAYQARSQQLLNQQCINAFVEPTPKEGKTQAPVYGIPGLSLFARMGNGPMQGLHIMGDLLYAVSGDALYAVTDTGAATLIGSTTLGGLVSMADNLNQLVMVDGNVGWIYQPAGLNIVTTESAAAGFTGVHCNVTGNVASGDTLHLPLDNGAVWTTTANGNYNSNSGQITWNGTLPSLMSAGAIITDPANVLGEISALAFQPASVVRYFDGYFVFNATGTREFFLSGINDGTQYSGLDFATASAGSDKVIGIEVYHEQLLIFCQLQHTEVWWDTGNVSFPFQRYDAAFIARGLSAALAVCSEDNTVFWMGDDGIFYRLEGFLPKRVSTFAMEHAWAQYPQKFLDASCFVIDQEGHKFIVVNFASAPATWCYDISTSLWHQRESWGTAWV